MDTARTPWVPPWVAAGSGWRPGAQWIGCVDLARNLGNPAYYLDCLQFMLAPFPYGGDPLRDGRPDRGADVLTNSWGCPGIEGCDRDALLPAIDALTAAGVFVVAAAGNTGPRCGSITDPPAPYPDTITVGAVDAQRDGRRTSPAVDRFPGPRSRPEAGRPRARGRCAVRAAGRRVRRPVRYLDGRPAHRRSRRADVVGEPEAHRRRRRYPTDPRDGTAGPAGPDGCGDSAGIVDAYTAA